MFNLIKFLKSLRFSNKRPKAMAFIDYEYWYYSYKNRFGLRPDPAAWRKELEKEYDIDDIMVFADFSSPGLSAELNSLRQITNTIIETSDNFLRNRKDMTDFVMLDYIYQSLDEHKGIKTYILLTGDGHFQSVVKYMTQKKRKSVVIYGVEDTFSKRLVLPSIKTVMLPMASELAPTCARHVIQDLAYCADKNIIPTIKSTAETVARRHNLQFEQVRATIFRMLDKGYLYQEERQVDPTHNVKIIVPRWERLIDEQVWDADKSKIIDSEFAV